jgi:hypothetical protein
MKDHAAPHSAFWLDALRLRLEPQSLEWCVQSRAYGYAPQWFFGLDLSIDPALLWTCAALFNGGPVEMGEARLAISGYEARCARDWGLATFGPSIASHLNSRAYWPQENCLARFPQSAYDKLALDLPGHALEIARGSGMDQASQSAFEAAILRGSFAGSGQTRESETSRL